VLTAKTGRDLFLSQQENGTFMPIFTVQGLERFGGSETFFSLLTYS
jgi:hypothetical protein